MHHTFRYSSSPVAEIVPMLMTPWKKSFFGLRKEVTVLQYERGLLYREGRLEKILEPGRYVFSKEERVEVAKVSLREMSHIVGGQFLLSSDRIEVRISLIAQYRVVDVEKAFQSVENFVERFHQDLQLSLREAIAGRTMEQILDDRSAIANELQTMSVESAARYGLEVTRIGVRDISLPQEIQRLMTLEVTADRTGKAELVKARHEVAAARARANTAKILTESPEVARMQELDVLLNLANKNGTVIMLPNLAELLLPRERRSSETKPTLPSDEGASS